MRRHAVIAALYVALGLSLSLPAQAFAAPVPNSVIGIGVMGLTNEVWQHTSYMYTAPGLFFYGVSADINTSGLALDGFDDQHEVSITIYASTRNGETGHGLLLCNTYAVALMRNWRERESVGLFSRPDSIDVVTLSTSVPADRNSNWYLYPRGTGEATLTVAAHETHNLQVISSGVSAFVKNEDDLVGKRTVCDTAGVPVACDWEDITDTQTEPGGHTVYRWDTYLDGRLLDSSWLDSDRGRIKLESNKRHATLAAAGSQTAFTGLQVVPAPKDAPQGAAARVPLQPWDASVLTTNHVTRGLYSWDVIQAYTSMLAVIPCAPPKPAFVKFTNPIAYRLKSLQSTRFSTSVDKANTWAELTVKCPTGVKTIFKGVIPKANETFTFPAWNGMGPDGKQLPSSSYDWALKLTQNGSTGVTTGKITVSKVCFTMTGRSVNGVPKQHIAYMIPGNANCYVAATTPKAADHLGITLSGPGSYRAVVGSYDFGAVSRLARTAYVKDANAVRTNAVHTFSITGRSSVTYSVLVIQ